MRSQVLPTNRESTNLKSLLSRIRDHMDADFSGLGVVVWDGTAELPIYPMRGGLPESMRLHSTIDVLKAISRVCSPYHDGFHILDASLQLTQASVYFSPAIVPDLIVPDQLHVFGGRFLAATFGSCLQGVLCTGVLSEHYGPYVFAQGRAI